MVGLEDGKLRWWMLRLGVGGKGRIGNWTGNRRRSDLMYRSYNRGWICWVEWEMAEVVC